MSVLEFAVDVFLHLTLMHSSFTASVGSLFTCTYLVVPINYTNPEVRIGLCFCVSSTALSLVLLHNKGAYSSIKDKCQFVKVDLFVKEVMLASFYLGNLRTLH